VAIGAATRLVRFVQDQPKQYRGTFQLGLTTDTDDITGTVRATHEVSGLPNRETASERRLRFRDSRDCLRARLLEPLNEFVGEISQVPPVFPAVHIDGKRAYDLARQGVEMELTPRTVNIYSLELVDLAPPYFTLDVNCSGGTYIRSLGRDIGQRLGCGAVM